MLRKWFVFISHIFSFCKIFYFALTKSVRRCFAYLLIKRTEKQTRCKTKICFISLSSYPLFNSSICLGFGGAEVQLFILSTKLARDSHFEVSCIVGDYGQSAVEIREGVTLYRSPDYIPPSVRERFISMVIRKTFKWWRRILFFIRLVILAPDFFVIRSASKGVGLVRLWSYIFGGKLVYMIAHEIDCSGEYERLHPDSSAWYRFGLVRADSVVAQHADQEHLLRAHYGIQAVVLPSVHGMSDEAYERGEYVLWVGRCEPWKRPDLFIELARRCSSHRFVMIAPPAKNQEQYASLIERACADVPNLSYIGLVPFHSVDEYFRRAILFTITSHYEGFPNTLIQAAKYKKAIVSLSVNPDSIFDRHDIGGCAHNDKNLFFDMVSDLLNDSLRLRVCGHHAFEYVQKHHSLDVYIDAYKTLFTSPNS